MNEGNILNALLNCNAFFIIIKINHFDVRIFRNNVTINEKLSVNLI